jgi:hypothetical protein
VTDEKKIAFFTFYDFLLAIHNESNKKFEAFVMKPILPKYSKYNESKNMP